MTMNIVVVHLAVVETLVKRIFLHQLDCINNISVDCGKWMRSRYTLNTSQA